MSEMHTPGPWSVSDDTVRDGLPSVLIHGSPEGMLAIVRIAHQGGYYGHANARLISAAPDLLAALKAIVFDWDGELEDMLDAIEAIAKAEGKS